MYRYVIKRLLFLIPTVLGVTFIIFLVLSMTPGDPGRSILGVSAPQEAVDQLNEELGVNDPFLVRYADYIKDIVVEQDFGTSYVTKQPVFAEVLPRFIVTLKLSLIGMILSTIIGVPLGMLAAVKQYSPLDTIPSLISFFLAAIPAFVLGMVLLFVFSLNFNILPSYGLDTWKSYIMPSLTMAIPIAAINIRFTKSSMLESIREDFIRTARAKGASEKVVIWRHALKNAMLPVITNIGLNLGQLIVSRIQYKDEPVIIAGTILIAVTFTVIMLIVDLIYAYIDPRIKAKYVRAKA